MREEALKKDLDEEEISESLLAAIASEEVLAKDWLSEEDNEEWQDL